jgi:hypothetical protein
LLLLLSPSSIPDMNFTNPNRPETFFVCPPQGESILLLPRVCPCDISAVLLRCVWSILNPSLGQQYENNARWVHTRDSDMISAQSTKKLQEERKKSRARSLRPFCFSAEIGDKCVTAMAAIADLLSARAFQVSK